MKLINKYTGLLALSLSLAACCTDKDENFENKAYINAPSMVSETIIKDGGTMNKSFEISLARPTGQDLKFTYRVDASQVETYNKAYYANAELLSPEYYELPSSSSVTIAKGAVKSEAINLSFKNLSGLDRDKQYVLPISLETGDISLLGSAKTYYYVFRAGALIDVVADIEDNYFAVNWNNPAPLTRMEKLTMEALIRVRNYDQLITTVMGVEGHFLMRIGDAGYPSSQIQISARNDKFPASDPNKTLPTNKWTHVAVTYDYATRETIVYVNGQQQSKGVMNNIPSSSARITLATSDFFIGRSYSDDRDLNGEIAEARIWNVVRTQEQIVANPYTVDPESEGLVAYWKFNDEEALTVKDHTSNGNHAIAKRGSIKWTAVSLPATK